MHVTLLSMIPWQFNYTDRRKDDKNSMKVMVSQPLKELNVETTSWMPLKVDVWQRLGEQICKNLVKEI